MTWRTAGVAAREVGERLRIARRTAKLTQAQAAREIQIARTTLVAIEQGQRKVRMDELQKLASLFGTSANAILREEAVHLDLVPRFRKLRAEDQATEDAAQLMTDLVSAEVELENALGVRRFRNYPPERPILPGDVVAQAEQDAQDLRDWLGLGVGPVLDIFSLLELQLGVRIYLRKLHASISGIFAYDDAIGACMLLNANHPLSRLTQTAAHELGHFYSIRRKPEVVRNNARGVSREERYAASFARCFLTPVRALKQRFAEMTAGHSFLTRRHVILLAYSFRVSREAIVRRLEELNLARRGTWDWFMENGGITDAQARQVLGKPLDNFHPLVADRGHVPFRVALLLREAARRSLYSEGQLAHLLKLHRRDLRELLADLQDEECEANELTELPR